MQRRRSRILASESISYSQFLWRSVAGRECRIFFCHQVTIFCHQVTIVSKTRNAKQLSWLGLREDRLGIWGPGRTSYWLVILRRKLWCIHWCIVKEDKMSFIGVFGFGPLKSLWFKLKVGLYMISWVLICQKGENCNIKSSFMSCFGWRIYKNCRVHWVLFCILSFNLL